MGFPTEFFPVLFAIPRMAGYLSHWRESLDDPDTKIMRPAQVSSPPLNQTSVYFSCVCIRRILLYYHAGLYWCVAPSLYTTS